MRSIEKLIRSISIFFKSKLIECNCCTKTQLLEIFQKPPFLILLVVPTHKFTFFFSLLPVVALNGLINFLAFVITLEPTDILSRKAADAARTTDRVADLSAWQVHNFLALMTLSFLFH